MNLAKLTSSDTFTGRLLVVGKATLDIGGLLLKHPSRQTWQWARLIFKVKPRYTMVKNAHLLRLSQCVQDVNRRQLPGDLVECGVWNGGSAAFMAVADRVDRPGPSRAMWLFDSFQGLPRPTDKDGEFERRSYFMGWTKGSVENVQHIFTRLHISLERVSIVPGWFNETLPITTVETIALLHIDADWYDSVMTVLQCLYDRVVPGGFVVLDDYGFWQGCQQAVRDFFIAHELDLALIRPIDKAGAYFQKPV